MRLADLARAATTLSIEAFRSSHPEPVLVVLAPKKAKAQPATTTARSPKTQRITLEDTGHLALPTVAAFRPNVPLDADATVIPLKKTNRNPFASMITLGRANNNDVLFPFNSVSKVHAYLTWTKGWTLTDQRATNGTLVNGAPLPQGGSMPLEDGACISLGPEVLLRFFLPEGFYKALRTRP